MTSIQNEEQILVPTKEISPVRIQFLKKKIKDEIIPLKKEQASPAEDDEADYEYLFKDILVDFDEEIEEPPTILEIKNGWGYSSTFTLGNFSLFIGSAKSGKTTLVTHILRQFLKNDDPKYRTILPTKQKKILWFDTEQSKWHIRSATNRVLKNISLDERKPLKCCRLRKHGHKERRDKIDDIIKKYPGIGLIIIDGVRDLISDINISAEANSINADLLRWTEERNIHIITVLHTNKGDEKARGHIGTELVNKAETVIMIDENDGIHTVTPKECRDRKFDPYSFTRSEDNEIITGENSAMPKNAKSGRKKQLDFFNDEYFKNITEEVFAHVDEHGWKNLHAELISSSKKMGKFLSTDKASKLIPILQEKKFVIKEAGKYKKHFNN